MATKGTGSSSQDDAERDSACAGDGGHEPRDVSERAGLHPNAGNHFPFLSLSTVIQSRVVDFLGFIDLTSLRATCRTMRTLPTRGQRRRALLEYERDRKNFFDLWGHRDSDEKWRDWIESRTDSRQHSGPARETHEGAPEWIAELNAVGVRTFDIIRYGKGYEVNHRYLRYRKQYLGCYECLSLLSTYKFANGTYETFHIPEGGLKDALASDATRRYCIDCRLRSTDKRIRGWGWLSTYGCEHHIRCSRCQKWQESSFYPHDHQGFCDRCYLPQCDWEKFKPEYECRCFMAYDIDGDYVAWGGEGSVDEVERARDDEAVCHRLFKSDLCRDCFAEENATWFAFKQHLRDEIAVRGRYLKYMEQVDAGEFDLAPPLTDEIVAYWQ